MLQGLIARELNICSKTDVRIVADHLSLTGQLNIKYRGKGLTRGTVNNLRPNLYKTLF